MWTVANDDNRVQDGLDLRSEWLSEGAIPIKFNNHDVEEFKAQPCSFLEVLIAMSRRMAFIAEGHPQWWAWHFIKNIELDKMRDPLSSRKVEVIQDTMDAIIWRTYNWTGEGGFFPLKSPKEDQTKVELWYQMNAYAIEFDHIS